MNLAQSVANCAPLNKGLQPSLQALETAHKKLLKIDDSRRLQHSINLEMALVSVARGMKQWDYAIGWQAQSGEDSCCFAEVHPAHTTSVSEVVEKKQEVSAWLRQHAPEVLALAAATVRRQDAPVWHWLATAAPINIRKGSPGAKRLAQAGIHGPIRILELD
jgi:hypothetical protein